METLNLLSLPILLFLFYTITHHFLHKLLNYPPTPFPTLPILGHLYLFTRPEPLHRALSRLSRRRGPLLFLRLGRRSALLVSSPSAARDCLAQNDIVFANRPDLLNGKHFGYDFTSLAWAPYGPHWRNLRRISALELLSPHKLDVLAGIRAEEARSMIRRLLESPSGVADMDRLFFRHAYGVVRRMVTGEAAAEEEAERFREIVAEMTAVTMEANVVEFVPFVGWMGFRDVERKFRSVQEKRDGFMKDLVENHRRKEGDRNYTYWIQLLLDLQREEPDYYTDQTIRNLLLVLFQGAVHSTSNTLEWAFSLLLQHPHTLSKAAAQIHNLVGETRLLSGSDLPNLPYLLSVINETLRMHPATPLLTPHVSSEDCTVAGHRVPRGTMLLVNTWEIQNNPETWEDPEEFVPERFEGGGGKSIGFEFGAFGWGRRACPGEKLAVQMVGAALGSLVQCFEWEKVGEIDMREGKGVITPRAQPLRARCVPRSFVGDLLCD